MIPAAEMPYAVGMPYRDGEPIVYDSGDYQKALRSALDAIGGIAVFRQRQEAARADGRHLGLGDDDVAVLTRGGFLHDIGKVGIPDAILLKPARLTADEYATMQQHTIIGDRLCGELRSLREVRPIVRHHHERLDGSGYPDGLRGDAIPLFAQIIAIVDVFDALTTERPYKPALPVADACAELAREAGRGWHRPDLVEAFIHLVREGHLPRHEAGAARRSI